MGTVLPLTECVPATDTRRHSQSPTRHSCTCPAKGQLPGRSGRANRRPLRRRQSRRVRKVTGRPWVSATSPEFSATSPENYLTPGHHFLRGRLVRDKVLRLRVVSSLVDLSLPRAKRSRRSRSRSRSRSISRNRMSRRGGARRAKFSHSPAACTSEKSRVKLHVMPSACSVFAATIPCERHSGLHTAAESVCSIVLFYHHFLL